MLLAFNVTFIALLMGTIYLFLFCGYVQIGDKLIVLYA